MVVALTHHFFGDTTACMKMWLITMSMIAVGSLPIQLPQLKKYLSSFFVFGSGALLGLCVFHLFPNFIRVGGNWGIAIAAVVGIAYSLVHVMHAWQHADSLFMANKEVPVRKNFSPYFFALAFVGHNLVSGMFLGYSDKFGSELAQNIFYALLVHKVFEALVVSTALRTYHFNSKQIASFSFAYWLSLPAGFYLAFFPLNGLAQPVFLLISGLAMGSLAGCLVFDFALPSFRILRSNFRQLTWLLTGALMSAVASNLSF